MCIEREKEIESVLRLCGEKEIEGVCIYIERVREREIESF